MNFPEVNTHFPLLISAKLPYDLKTGRIRINRQPAMT